MNIRITSSLVETPSCFAIILTREVGEEVSTVECSVKKPCGCKGSAYEKRLKLLSQRDFLLDQITEIFQNEIDKI